jgi:hypothetical protein
VQDIRDVCCTYNSSVNGAVTFAQLLASIWLLMTTVDAFLNCEAAAVHLLNLMHCLPENTDQACFVLRQQHAQQSCIR